MISEDIDTDNIVTCSYNAYCLELEYKKLFIMNTVLHFTIQKQQFTCDLCAASYSCKYDLTSHLDIHTGIGLYKCEDRSTTF